MTSTSRDEARGRLYGGIEAGGTKWVCAVGNGPSDMSGTTFPTTEPDETIARAVDFFAANGGLAAVGVGSFGPIERRRSSQSFGFITTTPKPGWAQTDLAGRLEESLDVPVAFDTDVNAAALGEQRWGAAVGLDSFCYVTVGTGIGGGVVVNGRLVHGLLHPELGHMRIPHDRVEDPFPGSCPYHGDCFEGLASGEAMRLRWGKAAHDLDDDAAWQLEAHYLALGLTNVICAVSPERIILGGGVMKEATLLARVQERLRELLAGYFDAPELEDRIGDFVVRPGLGDRAGVLGAIALAQAATAG
jgi:fructokinase